MSSKRSRERNYVAYSYGYLLMAVHRAQKRIKEEARNACSFADCLSASLFSALAIEAFANHVGEKSFKHWKPLKEKLSACDKLDLIAEKHGVTIDWTCRPYQTLSEAIVFRNAVVHAETKEVSIDVISGKSGRHKSHWPTYCDRETAERISHDVEQVIKEFPGKIGIAMPREFLLAEQPDDESGES